MKCRIGFVSAPDQSRSLFTPVRDPAATLGSTGLLHHFGTTDRGSKDLIVMPRRHDCIFGSRSSEPQFCRVLGNDVVNNVVKFLTVLTPIRRSRPFRFLEQTARNLQGHWHSIR